MSAPEKLILRIKRRTKRSGPGKMSEIWKHFTLAVPGTLQAACQYCGKIMMRKDSSTKSMWGHLNAFHRDVVGTEVFMKKRKKRCSYKKIIQNAENSQFSTFLENNFNDANTSYGSTSEMLLDYVNSSSMDLSDQGEENSLDADAPMLEANSSGVSDEHVSYKSELVLQHADEGEEPKNIVKIMLDTPLKGQVNQISAVWKHFELVSPLDSLQVCCLICGKIMNRSDRSTKSMWGHLKAYHRDTVGEEVFSMKQKKRGRPATITDGSENAMQHTESTGTVMLPNATNFEAFAIALDFANLPMEKIEIIQMNGNEDYSLIKNEEEQKTEQNTNGDDNNRIITNGTTEENQQDVKNENGETNKPIEKRVEAQQEQNVMYPVNGTISGSQIIVLPDMPILIQQTNDFEAVPILNGKCSEIKHGETSFSLSDSQSLTNMLNIAIELDLTFSCHSRRGPVEYCFEHNRTSERSGGRGRMVSLVSVDNKVLVTERVNGYVVDAESWLQTDSSQLFWAVRGKCQKSLCK